MSSPDRNRNPSPPPEILESDGNLVPDRIGSSVYSKRWLYKALMNMLKIVQEYPSSGNSSSGESSMQTDMSSSNLDIIELNPEIEEEACTLWDMSASQEVAEFLSECDVSNIFLDIMVNTKSPRLLEIVIGILGNMSTFNSTCEYISNNKVLVCTIVSLSGCSDSCTLVQLFRLFTCGIVKENCQQKWSKSFEENQSFIENLKIILENNLCQAVLKGALEFLDKLFNFNPIYCCVWSEPPYILAIIESGKQLLKCNYDEGLDTFFTVVNTLCQQSVIVPAYAKNFDGLRPIFHAYFSKLGEEEYLPKVERVTTVASTFGLYGNLLFNGNVLKEHIIFDGNVFNAMLSICQMVRHLLINLKDFNEQELSGNPPSTVDSVVMTEEKNGDTLDEDYLLMWSILLDAVVHAAKACASHTDKANELEVLGEIVSFQRTAEDVAS